MSRGSDVKYEATARARACVCVAQAVTLNSQTPNAMCFLHFAPYFSQTSPKTFDYERADQYLTYDLQGPAPGAASALQAFQAASGAL